MGYEPLVSIAAAAYNHEKYIDRAVESILNQPYQNIQIVYVDDGSSDSTLSKLEAWARKDRRIEVYSQKNSGTSAAINVAVSKSKGEYIAAFSSDDLFKANRITTLVEYARNQNVDIVISRAELIDTNGRQLPPQIFPILFQEFPKTTVQAFRRLFWGGNFICAVGSLIRTEVARAGDFHFDERLLQLHDYYIWLKLAQKYKMLFVEDITVGYRVDVNSLSSSRNNIRLFNEYFLLFYEFTKSLGLKDMEVLADQVGISEQEFAIRMTTHPIANVRLVGLMMLYELSKSNTVDFHLLFELNQKNDIFNLAVQDQIKDQMVKSFQNFEINDYVRDFGRQTCK